MHLTPEEIAQIIQKSVDLQHKQDRLRIWVEVSPLDRQAPGVSISMMDVDKADNSFTIYGYAELAKLGKLTAEQIIEFMDDVAGDMFA